MDDDFETREIGSSVLRHCGFEVDAAGDGAVAWQALNTGRYDLLITTYKLPRMSGIELLMKLQAVHRALPVIIVAATLPGDQFTRYPWLKPAAMLPQSCTVTELMNAVNQVLCATEAAPQANRARANPPKPDGRQTAGGSEACAPLANVPLIG